MKEEEPENTLTPGIKLSIREEVESRLKDLPASTYQLIEKMVHDRVAVVERFWRNVIIIGGIVFAVVGSVFGAGFFVITAKNASKKASDAIANSAVGQKLEEVKTNYAQIQNIKNQLDIVAPEALTNATKITAKLRELESQDNIVRLSPNGNLVLNLQDGELRLRRNNTDKELTIKVNDDGQFRFFEGTGRIEFVVRVGGNTQIR